MSWLSKIASSPLVNPLGIGAGGPEKVWNSFGNQVFGRSPSMPAAPSWATDQAALQQEQQNEQNLTNQYMTNSQNTFNTQQTALQKALNNYRQNAETDLTTGGEGEQMREFYNRLGLLNSGAFNNALANRFGDIQQQSDQALLNSGANFENTLQGILGQGYQNQIDLGQSGLQRQYSLEDEQYQAALNQVLAKMKDQSQTKGSLIQAGGNILGRLLAKG